MQQGIHGKPSWAGTLSVSQSGAFSYCVTRFRGGALRHAKFPKTSYKVQLLDTLKHAACVSLNHRRRRGLIFLSSKVLAPFKQNASVLSGEGRPRTPTRHLHQSRLSATLCNSCPNGQTLHPFFLYFRQIGSLPVPFLLCQISRFSAIFPQSTPYCPNFRQIFCNS